jgi:hypothetical protein
MLNMSLDQVAEQAQRAIRTNNMPMMGRLLGQLRAMGRGLQPLDRPRAQQLALMLERNLRSPPEEPEPEEEDDTEPE